MDGNFLKERDRYKASAHFVWRQDPADILGEGSFGTVYRGLQKETCEVVAVKTFNRNTYSRPITTQLRELNIQQRLNHPNVVKLIAIEDEMTSSKTPAQYANNSLQGKVLIMEYCTEGSLYSIVEHPENHFGLDESELLRFLSHITAGMKYLQENKIIHRDWKPSNILKTVNDNGDVLYKLCDFGAAREIEANQPFQSIVGTEEYLHPEIFRRALLGGSTQYFSATSELWSVGVTLYHVATGQLPFRPYGGRKNREMMNKITYTKESGVISAVQETENGPIEWSKELPKHCRLSRCCRRFFTKVLAGLMEVHPNKVWSFERYFSEVEQFLAKICVRCCTTAEFRSQNIYVDRNLDYANFVKTASEDLNIINSDEVVCVKQGRLLIKAISFDLSKLANDTRKTPVIFATVSSNVRQSEGLCFPKLPKFSAEQSIERDVETAKVCSALGFWALRLTSEQDLWRENCDKAAVCLIDFLKNKMKSLESNWKLLKHHWTFVSNYFLEAWKRSLISEMGKKHVNSKIDSAKQVDGHVSFEERDMLNVATELRKVDENFPTFASNNLQQLKTNWLSIENHVNSNIAGAAVDVYKNYFNELCNVFKKINMAEESMNLLEQMVMAFENSLKQVVEENVRQNGPPCNSNIPNSLEHANNSISMDMVANKLIRTVEDAQECRRLVAKNREVYGDVAQYLE